MERDSLPGKGPHLKKCHCCGEEFMGRLNQKFLDVLHKARFNNEKRAKRLKPLALIFAQLETNYRLLKKYFLVSKGEWIRFSDMLREGFNANAPYNQLYFKDFEGEFRGCAGFAFQQSKDNKSVIIIKYKIDGNNS